MSSMPKDDLVRIRHMYDATMDAVHFVKNKTRTDLDEDRMLALSLVKTIEIIGEAASRVSKASRQEFPEIPWDVIVAMRNRWIHAYYDIDLDRVWDTIMDDLPPLASALEGIIRNKWTTKL